MTASIQALLGVALGALLATTGGFVATQITARIERRSKAVSAALLCGELLAALQVLLRLAGKLRVEGGAGQLLAIRCLRAARREVDVYDRNRELLFAIANADLRARVHGFMVRLSIALDGLFETHGRLSAVTDGAAGRSSMQASMDVVLRYLVESGSHVPALLTSLQPIARQRLDVYRRIGDEGIIRA